MTLKLYSFNVNGIRAALSKGFDKWLSTENIDIVSLQEIKATPEQFDPTIFERLGYYTYWYPAEKKGYSGVAVLTRQKPDRIFYGMGINAYDQEGRLIRTDYADFTLISVYFPSGTMGDVRQNVKMKFLKDFEDYILDLAKQRTNLIISGDFNIAHQEIDINYPEKHNTMSGFLPEERDWFTRFLSKGFIDSFRVYNNQAEQYSWWTYRAGAREKNLGWRIDYNLVSTPLMEKLVNANIHSGIVMSDHCPVSVEIQIVLT
jgi:exodeoxyribonuclease III